MKPPRPKAIWTQAFPDQMAKTARSRRHAVRLDGLEELYPHIALLFLHACPKCRRCSRPATEVHHRAGRVGMLLIDVRYFMSACADCHRFIHQNPALAKQDGYLL